MTASEMYRDLGLGVELCRTYLSFKHVSKECPVGPIVAATENLAEMSVVSATAPMKPR